MKRDVPWSANSVSDPNKSVLRHPSTFPCPVTRGRIRGPRRKRDSSSRTSSARPGSAAWRAPRNLTTSSARYLLLDGTGGDLPKARDRDPRLFEIIDGQQRLVTLAMIAAVLRDLGTERWRWGARNRLDQLIAANSAATKQHGVKFRVEVSAREQAFLETYVQMRGGCSANARRGDGERGRGAPAEGARSLHRELSLLDEGDRRRLADYLCDQCHFVVVLTRDIDRAHRLFTVLNERGRALQRNDILKAEILKSIPRRACAGCAGEVGQRRRSCSARSSRHSSATCSASTAAATRRSSPAFAAPSARSGGPEAFLNESSGRCPRPTTRCCAPPTSNLSLDPDARRYLVYLGRLPEGDWAPAAMLAVHQYADDPERATLLLQEIDRLVPSACGCSASAQASACAASAMWCDFIKSRAPVTPGEGPFQLSRDEVRNIGYHLRTMYGATRRCASSCCCASTTR